MFRFFGRMSADRWVDENVKFYRSIGFFADYGKLSDGQLIGQIKQRLGRHTAPTDTFMGLDIALLDKKRVVRHNPMNLDRNTAFFAAALDQWAYISRGILRPERIGVQPDFGNTDKTLIEFTQSNRSYRLFVNIPLYGYEWLDHAVFDQLNAIFVDTGFCFEVADMESAARTVLVLTEGEKEKLVKDRKWSFVSSKVVALGGAR